MEFGPATFRVRDVRLPFASYVYVMTEPSAAMTPMIWPVASRAYWRES